MNASKPNGNLRHEARNLFADIAVLNTIFYGREKRGIESFIFSFFSSFPRDLKKKKAGEGHRELS